MLLVMCSAIYMWDVFAALMSSSLVWALLQFKLNISIRIGLLNESTHDSLQLWVSCLRTHQAGLIKPAWWVWIDVFFHLVTQFYTPLYTNVYWALFSSVNHNFSWLILVLIFFKLIYDDHYPICCSRQFLMPIKFTAYHLRSLLLVTLLFSTLLFISDSIIILRFNHYTFQVL